MARKKLTTEEFIERARKVHGDKYDYSKAIYNGTHTPVIIICPTHGEFKQTAHHHLLGANCPDCVCVNARRGILGVGNNDILRSKKSQAYFIWRNMINRAHDPKIKSKHPTYENCTVCDEWMNFSNFKKWFDNPENGYREGYHLDKDIIVKGNKTYSPNTCCFVPHRINVLFVQNNRRRGNLPIGVIKRKSGRYTATVCKDSHNVVLGTFDTICEAFAIYKTEKEAFIKETANAYYSRGEITSRVYDAMMNYKVDITD